MEEQEEIVRRYGSAVYRLAFAKTGSAADAEDVFQETFLRYFRKRPEFQSEEHRKAWLLRVAVNCANTLHHAPWRRYTQPLEEAAGTGELPWEAVALWDILRRLPEKDRTILHLFYYEDLSTDQIAQVTGQKSGTVRSRLTRAREKLKTEWEDCSCSSDTNR